MAARLPFGAPGAPQDFEALLDQLRRDVLPFMGNSAHPGYMAFIPTCGTFPGALGDFIASALNVYVGSWMEGAGPSRIELVVLDWFKEWIGYPGEAAGVLVCGGSAANLTALACARETLLGPMDDRATAVRRRPGPCLDRARRAGARLPPRPGPRAARPTPINGCSRRRVAAAIQADAAAGRRPLAVVAAAGATNTGAIDPLGGLAAVCRRHGVWLHVDAAYGGFAALTERGRRALAGLELADSVTLDPHKWLYQPIECGSLLVRDGHLLQRAFAIEQDYLHDAAGHEGEVELRRPRAAAQPQLPGAEGLALDQPLRRAGVPERRSMTHSTWPSWHGSESPRTTGSKRSPPASSASRASGAAWRAARTRPPGSNAALIAALRGQRPRTRSVHSGGRALRRAALRAEPHHARRARRGGARLLRHRATRPAAQRRRCPVAAHDGPRRELAALSGPASSPRLRRVSATPSMPRAAHASTAREARAGSPVSAAWSARVRAAKARAPRRVSIVTATSKCAAAASARPEAAASRPR